MEPQRPPEDARFEGIGDWLVSHGQDALARGAGRRPTGAGSGRARARRMARILVGVAAVAVLAWIILNAVSAPLAGFTGDCPGGRHASISGPLFMALPELCKTRNPVNSQY